MDPEDGQHDAYMADRQEEERQEMLDLARQMTHISNRLVKLMGD